jgi:transcriptional regulator GlxA family with amidase domain
MRTTLALLGQEVGASGVGEELIIARLADILLAQALRAFLTLAGGASPSWLAGLADPRLGRALRAFHAEVGDEWSVGRLAAEAGMSRSSFADNFHRRTGLTPMDYVARWRLFRIRSEVMRTDRPIALIAEENGWRSRTSCSRAFKDLFGVSPREAKLGSALTEA